MTQQTVGKVYAEALFLLAQEEHQEQKVYQELNDAADMFAAHPEFVSLLNVPTLEIRERIAILRRVIGDGTGAVENFLCLLIEKHRINRMEEIRTDFNKLYYDAFHIAEVFVTTAVALDDKQRTELKQVLGKKLNRTIELRESVDPAILGGMIVQYGDTRMDNSLRSRMRQFRQPT